MVICCIFSCICRLKVATDDVSKYATQLAKENGALVKRVRELELQLARGGHAVLSKQATPKRRTRIQVPTPKQVASKAVQVAVESVVDETLDTLFTSEQSELIQQLKLKLVALELNLERVQQDEKLRQAESTSNPPKPEDMLEIHEEMRSKLIQLQMLEVYIVISCLLKLDQVRQRRMH